MAIGELKPGKSVQVIQQKVFENIVSGLLDIGIVKGKREELIEDQIFRAFMPHSLGHYLGLYVHDVGPTEKKTGDNQPPTAATSITARDRLLEPGMVLTVEPGIYFIDSLLSSDKHAKHINLSVLNRFRHIGGVRIEDNVEITKTSHRNLTTAVKSPASIEWMIESLRSELTD